MTKKIIIFTLISVILVGTTLLVSQPVKAWNHPTHTFITQQAWAIFQKDNQALLIPFQKYQAYVPQFYDKLVKGVLEADTKSTTVASAQYTFKFGGKSYTVYMPTSEHYYNPENGLGAFYFFRSAKQKAEEYYNLALENWRNKKYEDSVYNLGRAMHMVQDVTLPQHTYNGVEALLNQEGYANWLDRHFNEYKVESGATYNVTNIGNLVHSNAATSHPLLKYVDGLNPWWIFPIFTKDNYPKATTTLLPLAQKTGAALIYKYANDILTIEAANQLQPKKQVAPVF